MIRLLDRGPMSGATGRGTPRPVRFAPNRRPQVCEYADLWHQRLHRYRLLIAFIFTLFALSPATTPGSEPKQTTFASIDVYLDSHDHPLAAYQLEVTTPPNVTLVGLEAGDPAAFARTPPYYDPAAMGHNRIILAAYSTDPHLPHGRSRIAKLHLMIENPPENASVHYTAKLLVAADADGKAISGAAVSVQ